MKRVPHVPQRTCIACRQVGGKADQIVLWLLGGVAYVSLQDGNLVCFGKAD